MGLYPCTPPGSHCHSNSTIRTSPRLLYTCENRDGSYTQYMGHTQKKTGTQPRTPEEEYHLPYEQTHSTSIPRYTTKRRSNTKLPRGLSQKGTLNHKYTSQAPISARTPQQGRERLTSSLNPSTTISNPPPPQHRHTPIRNTTTSSWATSMPTQERKKNPISPHLMPTYQNV
jgi:hypothetical protein